MEASSMVGMAQINVQTTTAKDSNNSAQANEFSPEQQAKFIDNGLIAGIVVGFILIDMVKPPFSF